MTQDGKKMDLDSIVRATRDDVPNDAQTRDAAQHVWQKMQAAPALQRDSQKPITGCNDVRALLPEYSARTLAPAMVMLVDAHLRECLACRRHFQHAAAEEPVRWTAPVAPRRFAWRMPAFAMSAVAVAALAIGAFIINNMYFTIPAGARATVQSLDGTAYVVSATGERSVSIGDPIQDGETLRTSGKAHAFVKLSDGSVLEMSDRSEFTPTARGHNMTVALDQGKVIVEAAKRHSGHLYVKTPDCRVAVTGTVFSVNAGVKGSRVSVIEGAVQVADMAGDSTLHPGDQAVTGENMGEVPVAEDISWSSQREKYVELLAQFAQLQKKLEQVQLPAPRFTSNLADRVPADTVLYASIPNIGQALSQANTIFHNQLAQSAVLRDWWMRGNSGDAEEFNQTIDKLRQMSEYLGDEVVVAGFNGANGTDFAVMSEIRRSGLAEFLPSLFKDAKGGSDLLVVDPHALVSLTPANARGKMIALVRDDVVVFSPTVNGIDRINAQLNAGPSTFLQADFGARVNDAYTHGAGFLIAANLHAMITADAGRAGVRAVRREASLERSGFGDMQYLIAEHREVNGTPDNRLVVDFASQRRGVASWLAPPAPMGSLEFVSRNAGLAFAFLAKEPQLIFDDMMAMTTAEHPDGNRELTDSQNKLRLRWREDVAAQLGGDAVIALDGPVLPMPAWKLVVEVHDPAALEASLEKLIAAANDEARQHGHGGLALQHEDVGGQRFYTVQNPNRPLVATNYTFADGYMIVAQSRAFLMDALRVHATGDSLARSADFKKLLPNDGKTNYSAIVYQNLTPVLQPLVSQLPSDKAAILEQLAVDAHPSVICAWGEQSRIEATSNSRLFGFEWLALGSLLDSGTHGRPRT